MKSARIALVLFGVLLLATIGWVVARRPSTTPGHSGAADVPGSHPVTNPAPSGDAAERRVWGTVVTRAGDPIANATVIAGGADRLHVRTSADGAWSLDLPEGPVVLSATAPGYAPASVDVSSASSGPISFVLEPHGTALSGFVNDATGGVVAGAIVRVAEHGTSPVGWPARYGTLTDDRGWYSLPVASRSIVVSASHPDYAGDEVRLSMGGGSRRHDFSLIPASGISGTVRTASDRMPVANAIVVAGGERVVADSHGRYEIRGLAPGRLSLSAYARGLSSRFDVVLDLGLAEQRDGVDLVLAPATDVSGVVVYAADGSPADGADVRIVDGRSALRVTTADEDGRFEFIGVAAGAHAIVAKAEGCLESLVTFVPEDAPLEIAIGCGDSIVGRVSPPMKASVTGLPSHAPIAFLASEPVSSVRAAISDDDGVFTIGPFEKTGQFVLRAEADNGWKGETLVDVGAESSDVLIVLEERYALRGVVKTSSGDPVPHAQIEAYPVDEADPDTEPTVEPWELVSSYTDSEGAFHLKGLREGGYRLTVLDASRQLRGVVRPRGGYVAMAAADVEDFEVEVEASSGTITGRVVFADGSAAGEGWVQAIPEETTSRFVRKGTDLASRESVGRAPSPVFVGPDGTFRVSGLCPGLYRVEATSVDDEAFGSMDGVETGTSVEIAMRRGGTITGTVSENGNVLEEFRLDLAGPSPSTTLVASSEGRFFVDGLEPGEYDVFVSRPDQRTGPGQKVTVAADEQVELSFELEPLSVVTGRLVDDDGYPVRGATVVPSFSGAAGTDFRPAYGLTNDDGEFVLEAPAGTLRITVYGYPGHQREVSISGDAEIPLGTLKPFPLDRMLEALGPKAR